MTISSSELQCSCIIEPLNTNVESHHISAKKKDTTTQQSSSFILSEETPRPSPEMETKKGAAAIAAVCMLLLLVLSGQQQQKVAAMSFCDCYRQCHPWCRHTIPWWLCNVGCAGQCGGGDRADTLAACTMVCCTDFVCGEEASPLADGVEACVGECNKRWGHN